MARTRVIYQGEALYCSQDVAYNVAQTGTQEGAGVTSTPDNFNIKDLNRIQSVNYSFNVTRQDVNQFGDLAAIDQCIVEAPTVSLDASYYLADFTNEHRLGLYVTQSGQGTKYGGANASSNIARHPVGDQTVEASGLYKSAITNLIDSTTTAYQKNYFILTAKEGKDANLNSPSGVPLANSGNYESIIGIGNGFLSSYSTEGSVGGMPTVSIGVEGQNMNFVNLPYRPDGEAVTNQGYRTSGSARGNSPAALASSSLIGLSGESPAVNPINGTKYGHSVCLPIPTGNASGSNMGVISTLRPGDITLTLAKQTGDAITFAATGENTSEPTNRITSPDYAGASIADAHIQSYNIGFDLSRTAIQKMGVKYAFARPVDFPINVSLSVDAIVSDLTTGSLADIINCDDSFDARVTMRDPSCETDPKPIVCNYIVKGLKLDSESFSSDIGSNKTVTLDFSTQIGGPSQKNKGIFMSGYHNPDVLTTSGTN
tara:strand:- start:604 stop:2058 length:1455 start_codon:yes stop_codon:yes gene_type:complete